MSTVGEALHIADRSVSGRDAEVLLAKALGLSRAELHTHPERTLTPEEAERYEAYLSRREHNEPVAYITGEKEFYGRLFLCDSRALIPRPETEGLVTNTLAWCQATFARTLAATGTPCPLRILELGTGGGAIAISLALELDAVHIPATIIATDISSEALEQAQENKDRLLVGESYVRLTFLTADLFGHPQIEERPFDLIVANLPYVETTWQQHPLAQPDVLFYEPDVALFGGSDGLAIYRRFFADAPRHLNPEGAVMVEYGDTQTALFAPLAQAAFPQKTLRVEQDYAGLDRVVILS